MKKYDSENLDVISDKIFGIFGWSWRRSEKKRTHKAPSAGLEAGASKKQRIHAVISEWIFGASDLA